MTESTIRGYRIQADRPRQRELAMDYLQQTSRAAKLLSVLWSAPEKNCTTDPDRWTSDELPTDREAQLMCSGCPLLIHCQEYADEAHPAWGVFGGRVYGRRLAEAMKEEE